MPFTNTCPASISSMNRARSAASFVHTLEPSPNDVSLARRIASAASRTRKRAATGPNSYSVYAGEPAVMPVNTVGA